jgi:diguanylate cyclase (GGDEF)-like protein/putative nucleotidyltransferase with HDIG domain
LLAAIIASLVQRYRHATSVADRNRTLYLMVGWGFLLVLSYVTPFTGLSGLPTDHIGNLFNALIIAYAIYRLHLLDVRFVLRRGLAFTIIGVGIVSVSLGVSLLSQFLFPERQTLILVFVTVAVVLALVILGRPVVVAVQRAVDRLFFGETYMYRESLLAFSTKIGNIIELKELAEQMLSPICQALRITEARLMFQQNGNGRFTCQYVNPPTESRERDISLSVDNPIVQLLQKEDEPLDLKQIDVIPQLKGLWEADRERLANSGLEFLQPIKSHTQLIGILALGKKKSGGLYLAEDIDLIKNMSAQAAIIVDNARLYSQAVTWANTDGLTEIYNHRHFHERIDQEIARGSRFGSMFSLIIIDLDHFKTFNDNYGHLAGDEVLRRTASCIQSSIRTIDMAFRYGGEEFAVILPGTRLSDGHKVAERIRNTIETKASAGTIPVTASLGVASWPIDGMAKQDVIARADAALYQAKQTGRNRVVLSSEVVKGQTSLIGMELETKERAVSIIYALAATVDAKDHYTYGHSKKVSQYAVGMAEAMRLTPERVAVIRAAGLLHDIGKIAVPDSILNKAGPLTDEEWEPIKAHPELGMEILKHVIDLVNVLPGILHHHERFDGHGYPGALKGEEIPLEARVLAIADAYDAITSMRPYHTQMSTQ